MSVLAAAGWLLGLAALLYAITRADAWLDHRKLRRATIREAEHHTRTAAHSEDQP